MKFIVDWYDKIQMKIASSSNFSSIARQVAAKASAIHQRVKPFIVPILLAPVMPGMMAMGSAYTRESQSPETVVKYLFDRTQNSIGRFENILSMRLGANDPIYLHHWAIERFADRYPTVFAQSDFALALVRTGKTKEADKHIRAATAVTDVRFRAYTLSTAAIALIELGKTDEAKPLIDKAIKLEKEKMTRLDEARSYAALRTIEALIMLDRKEEALSLIANAKINRPARAYIACGAFEQALECKDLELPEKVYALTRTGDLSQALRITNSLSTREKINLLSNIVIALVRTNDLSNAEKVFARLLKIPGRKAAPRTELAIALFRAGEIEKALKIVDKPLGWITGINTYRPYETLDMAARMAQALLDINPSIGD